MKDIFSSFCAGIAVEDRDGWARYEASRGYQFDKILSESPMISLAQYCEKSRIMTWVCHSPDAVWGFFRTDPTILKPLDDQEALCSTRHLMAISTREDWRGEGFWKMTMEIIIQAAEESGIMLHGISRPFKMRWPEEIRNSAEMMWFLNNEHKFFSYIQNAKDEKRQSKRLLEKYLEVGMCGFKYPRGNGFSNHPKRKRFGFAYLSSETPAAIREAMGPFLSC